MFPLHDAPKPSPDTNLIHEESKSEELGGIELNAELVAELLGGWAPVLATYAHTMKIAVALTDEQGRQLGPCHNARPLWSLAYPLLESTHQGCPFCVAPDQPCTAVADSLMTGKVQCVRDSAGLAHLAVPLVLGGRPIGAIIAGQVFDRYPEPLVLRRVAKKAGVPEQSLWQLAIQEVPMSGESLKMFGGLLHSLGRAFLRERYAAILVRKLGETSQRYQLLIDGVEDYALFTVDVEGTVASWNRGAERLLGYTQDEIKGKNFSCLFTPEDLLKNAPANSIQRAGSEGWIEDDGWLVTKDGRQFWAHGVLASVGKGEKHEFGRLIRDTTEQRKAEEAMRQVQEQLAAERQRAEDANLAKSEFLAAMSHELRTPMTAILGMADMLWESELDSEQTQFVEVFRRAGANLLVIINDILDVSKIEAGHLDLENVEFDLEEVVDDAIELSAVKARAKGVLLFSSLVSGLPARMMGDPTRLRQILINLLGNAVKFTEAGEVVLTVEKHEPDTIEFTISDTGIGISPDKLEIIFDQFSQADASTTRKYGGTGLGLGICRGVVENMGGELTVTSSKGEGSTFRFTTPFHPAPEHNRAFRGDLEDLHGQRILVIDDSATDTRIIRETLLNWGLAVDVHRSPANALAGLAAAMESEQRYSLVLVDGGVSGIDWFDTVAEIRRIAPGLPVILLTFDPHPDDARRRKDAQLSGYAVKPVKRADLLRLICQAMQTRSCGEVKPRENPIVEIAEDMKPLAILVAEDSLDIRILINSYLKRSPHIVTFVEDGQAAVDEFSATNFDLILMDVRMPLMDGLAATRAIRAIEAERGAARVPIIALTANTRPQDVRMSLDAGCNDHFSKPIAKQKLLSFINEYGCKMRPAPAVQEPPIRIEISPGLESIVPGYLEDRKQEHPAMVRLLTDSDFGGLAVLAHRMKGSGDSYGFPELTRMGAALEHSAEIQNAGAIRVELTELSNYLDRVQLFAV